MRDQELLKQALDKAGSKGQLARDLLVCRRTTTNWFTGERRPSPSNYARLLSYVGVPSAEAGRLVADRVLGEEQL